MARHLAEAICELAAPPHQPCYIRLQAVNEFGSAQTLLLHVRPRPLAAGLEVAAYPGYAMNEEGTLVSLRRRGVLYALPTTDSGLERFAADVLAGGPSNVGEEGDPASGFVLSERASHYAAWWTARCDLHAPGDVQAAALPPEAGLGQAFLGLRFPHLHESDAPLPLASVELGNAADDYVSTQDARRSNKRKRESAVDGAAGEAAAAPAALPEPDSPAEYERKYRQLRDEAMAELTAALVTLLRHAARYRGTVEFEPPLPPAPAAAGGEQAGEQAAA